MTFVAATEQSMPMAPRGHWQAVGKAKRVRTH